MRADLLRRIKTICLIDKTVCYLKTGGEGNVLDQERSKDGGENVSAAEEIMIKVRETTDMEMVEKIRMKYLGRGLDELDSFSYHLRLIDEDGQPCAVFRMHQNTADSYQMDMLACCDNNAYKELLVRTMVLRCSHLAKENGMITKLSVVSDGGKDFYTVLGFQKTAEYLYEANVDNIQFCCE